MEEKMIFAATCWDDGLTTDIRLIEIFRKYHAKATFNLNPGFVTQTKRHPGTWPAMAPFAERLALSEYRSVYEGFCVASHGMMHLTPDTAADVFLKDAIDAKHFLEDMFQRECPGFAWPNGSTSDNPEILRKMREAGFRYGRTLNAAEKILPCAEPLLLPSTCHFRWDSFRELWEKAHEPENAVFYFWGHSCEMRDDPKEWARMETLVKMISEDPAAKWVDVIDLVNPEITSLFP